MTDPGVDPEFERKLERFADQALARVRAIGLAYGDDPALLRLKAQEFVRMLAELARPFPEPSFRLPMTLQAEDVKSAVHAAAAEGYGVAVDRIMGALIVRLPKFLTSMLRDPSAAALPDKGLRRRRR